jgi:acetate kinase
MGFTPLEGLVMGTRSGDIDPAIVQFLMEKENLSVKDVNNILNKNSGLLGLSETSNDVRELVLEAEHGSEPCRLALEVFAYRIRKFVGAYAAALGGLVAVVFTAGIGENSALVRAMTLEGLEFLGIALDPAANAANAARIGTGKVEVLVVPTDEELAIVRETVRILGRKPATPEDGTGATGRVALAEKELVELLLLLNRNPGKRLPEILESFNECPNRASSRRLTLHELELLLDGLDVRLGAPAGPRA